MYLSPCWKTNWEYPYRALSLSELLGESTVRPALVNSTGVATRDSFV